jgi:preprotein translocase subunit SecY
MENAEMRIPLQRISIHNIYADKNYLAIKFNPIGVMPAMFSMAFFMVPQMVVTALLFSDPLNKDYWWWFSNMSLNKPLGISIYIGAVYVLTLGFSRVFVNPKELTEQFLKSGDSVLGIHAGKDTRKYISRVINRLGFLSATVMSVCLGVPMLLQLQGYIDSAYVMLPSSIMMMTGIWCNLHREIQAVKDLEGYKPFI